MEGLDALLEEASNQRKERLNSEERKAGLRQEVARRSEQRSKTLQQLAAVHHGSACAAATSLESLAKLKNYVRLLLDARELDEIASELQQRSYTHVVQYYKANPKLADYTMTQVRKSVFLSRPVTSLARVCRIFCHSSWHAPFWRTCNGVAPTSRNWVVWSTA